MAYCAESGCMNEATHPWGLCKSCYFTPSIAKEYRSGAKPPKPVESGVPPEAMPSIDAWEGLYLDNIVTNCHYCDFGLDAVEPNSEPQPPEPVVEPEPDTAHIVDERAGAFMALKARYLEAIALDHVVPYTVIKEAT